MTFHPREGSGYDATTDPQRLSRRGFLSGVAAAGALGGLGSLLGACGGSSGSSAGTTGAGTSGGGGSTASSAGTSRVSAGAGTSSMPLPRPSQPVKWQVFSDNMPIASNLQPETGATLQVYNWVAYINQKVVNDFAKKYKCKVQITTFNTMTEALAKLGTGQIPFDVFVPTVDVLGGLVEAKLVRPLNHSYIPNISQAWPDFTNPFYDQEWQYTVPYTIYTTGIAWRKDHVPENPYKMKNPWAMPWQSKYRGRVAILDDYRESLSLGLMKMGNFDLNTNDPTQIAEALKQLQSLQKLTAVQIDNNDYSNLPGGKIWIHHAWSGDIASAASYMQSGVPVTAVGYWFPTDGMGPVANDTITVLKSGNNPVLAHLFMNYLLDLDHALENISFNGYMQPIEGVTPQRLIKEQILPPSLSSTVVLPSYFRRNVRQLELAPSVNSIWEQAWNQFSHGL